jgi:putative transposase
MGIDSNLDNITAASSDGKVQRFDVSRTTRIREAYKEVKSNLTRNDVRIKRLVFRKYGSLQRNRTWWILNNVSASVVKQAKVKELGIVMEDIRGIRKLYRKGNGQGRRFRSRLNSRSYRELQRERLNTRLDGKESQSST